MPFLIDGHNLIAQLPDLHLSDPDDEWQLVTRLRAYLWRVRKTGTVVFDGGQPGRGRTGWGNSVLSVRFAVVGQSADDVLLHLLAQEQNPRGWIVVSGDHAVQQAARRVGAQVRTATTFAQHLLAAPAGTGPKENGLRPEDAAAWEAEFQKAGNKGTAGK